MQNEQEINKEELTSTENNAEPQEIDGQEPVENAEGNEEKSSALKALQDEVTELKDKYLRLYSEFENFRRRTAKEKLEMVQTANEQLIKSLLPIADDFERAEKSYPQKDDKTLEGFILIHNKFKKSLEQYGVKPMPIEAGSDFNPDTQEAITQIPAPEEKLKGKVVDVIEKGYLLNEKMIRYAKVVIGN